MIVLYKRRKNKENGILRSITGTGMIKISNIKIFLCTRQKSGRIKTGGNVISQTYQILLVADERLRGKKPEYGQRNPAVLSDGLR